MISRESSPQRGENAQTSSSSTAVEENKDSSEVPKDPPEDATPKPPTPDDEFWLEDGNLTLIARESIEFRVYKGPLISNAPVFKDMLSLPQPDGGPSGCTCGYAPALVHLTDSPEDLRHLLRVLVPGKTPR